MLVRGFFCLFIVVESLLFLWKGGIFWGKEAKGKNEDGVC